MLIVIIMTKKYEMIEISACWVTTKTIADQQHSFTYILFTILRRCKTLILMSPLPQGKSRRDVSIAQGLDNKYLDLCYPLISYAFFLLMWWHQNQHLSPSPCCKLYINDDYYQYLITGEKMLLNYNFRSIMFQKGNTGNKDMQLPTCSMFPVYFKK